MRPQRIGIERGNAAQRPFNVLLAKVGIRRIPQLKKRKPAPGGRHNIDVEIPRSIFFGLQPIAAANFVFIVSGQAEPQATHYRIALKGPETNGVLIKPIAQDVVVYGQIRKRRIARLQYANIDRMAEPGRQISRLRDRLSDKIVTKYFTGHPQAVEHAIERPIHGIERTQLSGEVGELKKQRTIFPVRDELRATFNPADYGAIDTTETFQA